MRIGYSCVSMQVKTDYLSKHSFFQSFVPAPVAFLGFVRILSCVHTEASGRRLREFYGKDRRNAGDICQSASGKEELRWKTIFGIRRVSMREGINLHVYIRLISFDTRDLVGKNPLIMRPSLGL